MIQIDNGEVTPVSTAFFDPLPSVTHTPEVAPRPTAYDPMFSEKEKDLMDLINAYRSGKNLNRLVPSKAVCDLAAVRLNEIKSDWSHSQLFTKKVSVAGLYIENLARYAPTAQITIDAWHESPSHEANLVKQGIDYLCIRESDGYWVMIGLDPK